MSSAFIRQFQHRATRYLPRPTRPPGFKTRLDIRPKRFAIGLAEQVRWDKLKAADGAPVNAAFYMGRVLEVEPSGKILVAIWESPSGRELRAVLSAERDFTSESPGQGDVLRILTWMELPGGGARRSRRVVEIKRDPEEEEARRQRLREFLEKSAGAQANET